MYLVHVTSSVRQDQVLPLMQKSSDTSLLNQSTQFSDNNSVCLGQDHKFLIISLTQACIYLYSLYCLFLNCSMAHTTHQFYYFALLTLRGMRLVIMTLRCHHIHYLPLPDNREIACGNLPQGCSSLLWIRILCDWLQHTLLRLEEQCFCWDPLLAIGLTTIQDSKVTAWTKIRIVSWWMILCKKKKKYAVYQTDFIRNLYHDFSLFLTVFYQL